MSKTDPKPILNLIATRALVILGIVIVVYVGWQVFWKALTPDSLLRFLPAETTVAAVEQYGFSALPVVRDSYELLAVTEPELWLSEYPEIVAAKIMQLQPKRAVQSWQLIDKTITPLLIVETSLADYRGQNTTTVSVDVDDQTWYLQQFSPGYYFFTNQEAALPNTETPTLSTTPHFRDAQPNLPDQYFAAAYISPELAQFNTYNWPSYLIKEFTNSLGATYATLTPAAAGFTLITYTTPPTPQATYPTSSLRYQAGLTKYLPNNPQIFIGGRNFADRYLNLLNIDWQKTTAGLNLPDNSLKFLEQLLKNEIAYAKYKDAEFILIDNTTAADYNELTKAALALHNYLNPQSVSFQLRDESYGQKLIPAQFESLPAKQKVPYLSYGSTEWYFTYLPRQKTIALATNLEELYSLESLAKTDTLKSSELFYKTFLPVLRSSDELVHLNDLELPAPFENIDSITSSKNFFTDGIQTYNQIKLR